MGETIKLIAEIVNELHDILIVLTTALGFEFSDKQLHFWIIGIIGIFLFFLVQISFKWISKWSISTLSFVYTFTVLVVLVFAIEIQQKITDRGNMEFQDAVMGLWGFIFFFSIYIIFRLLIYLVKQFISKRKASRQL